MAETGYLASTVVMGLLGLGVLVLVLRGRRWEHYVPTGAYSDLRAGEAGPGSGLARLARSTGTWTALYVVLVLAFLGGAVAFSSGALTGPAVMAGLGAIIVAYVLLGVYFAMRGNGRPSAQAVAGSAIVGGMLIATTIVLILVMGI